MNNTKTFTNIAGIFSVLCWSLLPILALMTEELPTLSLLLLVYFSAQLPYVLMWIFIPNRFQQVLRGISVKYIVVNVLCLIASNFTFIKTMQSGDPVMGYLVTNLWPLATIIGAAMLFGEKLKRRHYFATLLGVISVLIISLPTEDDAMLYSSQTLFYALANVVCWSSFGLLNKYFEKVPFDAIGIVFFFACALLSSYLLYTENMSFEVYSSTKSTIAGMILGMLPWGLAFGLWGFAMRFGEIKTLSIFGYGMPVLGVIWMILFGYAKLTIPIMISLGMILTASILGTAKSKDNV